MSGLLLFLLFVLAVLGVYVLWLRFQLWMMQRIVGSIVILTGKPVAGVGEEGGCSAPLLFAALLVVLVLLTVLRIITGI